MAITGRHYWRAALVGALTVGVAVGAFTDNKYTGRMVWLACVAVVAITELVVLVRARRDV